VLRFAEDGSFFVRRNNLPEAMDLDFLIIGQGLAGSALAWQAWRRGARVMLVEREDHPGAGCSRIAAGLLNPLTGKSPHPAWRIGELLPLAREYYAAVADASGVDFFHDACLHREMPTPQAADDAIADPRTARWIDSRIGETTLAVRGAGWLDTALYLDSTRAFFQSLGSWMTADFMESEVRWLADGGAEWRGLKTRTVVVANGLGALELPSFAKLPFRPAAGRIVEVDANRTAPPDIRVREGKWLLRRGDGKHLAGATYEFVPPSDVPLQPPEEISKLLDQWCPGWTCRGVRAGVRPILRQSRPLAGRHPRHPAFAWLNGLGSKGVLTAPWAAAQLAGHLLENKPIDPELDATLTPRVHQLLLS